MTSTHLRSDTFQHSLRSTRKVRPSLLFTIWLGRPQAYPQLAAKCSRPLT